MSTCSHTSEPHDHTNLTWLAKVGLFLHRHRRMINVIQWIVVIFYVTLVVIPAFLPLPGTVTNLEKLKHLTILTNLTLFAEFCFWGIWWPFVLVSMVLFGRLWCGVFCPEGALTEFASKHGLGRPIPKWMRWNGWAFVAFTITTIYGQMVSVYQYPKAALLVLGGSTLAAIVIGFLFTKGKRSWCRYLCPVNGVFSVLSKLAPMHYQVNVEKWDMVSHDLSRPRQKAPDCAPMLNIRAMKGNQSCHMCARCVDYNDAVTLSFRSPTEEVVQYGEQESTIWQSLIIVTGLMGIAIGAFLWSTSNPILWPTYQWLVSWCINHNLYWPLDNSAPWYVLTNYPEVNDQFNWLYGACVIGFILVTAVIMSIAIFGGLALSSWLTADWEGFKKLGKRINHLAQGLIPIAAMGVFLGLSATTITLLKQSGYATYWAVYVRIACLALVDVYSLFLLIKILIHWRKQHLAARILAASADEATHMSRHLSRHDWWLVVWGVIPQIGVLALVNYAWYLMFWGWS